MQPISPITVRMTLSVAGMYGFANCDQIGVSSVTMKKMAVKIRSQRLIVKMVSLEVAHDPMTRKKMPIIVPTYQDTCAFHVVTWLSCRKPTTTEMPMSAIERPMTKRRLLFERAYTKKARMAKTKHTIPNTRKGVFANT